MKQRIITIVLIIIVSNAIIYALYAATFEPNRDKNGFNRKFANDVAIPLDTLITTSDIGEISGLTSNSIYLRTVEPGGMLQTDWGLKRLDTIIYKLPKTEKILSRLQFVVDSPFVIIYAGNGPTVFKGDLNGNIQATSQYKYPLYVRSVKVGEDKYIFRAFDTLKKPHQVFALWDGSTGKILKLVDPFGKTDGIGLNEDGTFQFDPYTHTAVFTEFYKNGLIAFDTNLNVIYHTSLIDTIKVGKAATGSYSTNADTYYTNSAPKFLTNSYTAVSEGHLFVNSLLRADNEDPQQFSNSIVIDEYEIISGRYLRSIYVPAYNGMKINSFGVRGNYLVGVYRNVIVRYAFPT
jgi:hypothetical protein